MDAERTSFDLVPYPPTLLMLLLLIYRHGFTFRKEGHTKIIEYELSNKQRAAHAALNLKRPDVLLSQMASAPPKKGKSLNEGDSDSDVDMSGSSSDEEGEGDAVDSDEDPSEEETAAAPTTETRAKTASGKVKGIRGRNERVMSADECRAHLRRLFAKEAVMCSLLFGRHGPFSPLSRDNFSFASADMFFLEVIPVAPTRFRPPAKLGETLFEHPQNELLAKVLTTSYRLRDLNVDLRAASQKGGEFDDVARKLVFGRLLETLVQLQIDVNSFMDSSKNPTVMRQGKLPPAGVKQGLEKKEGLFRKNMMVPFLSSQITLFILLIRPRENVSTMQRVPSSLLMSISNPMRLAYRLSLRGS